MSGNSAGAGAIYSDASASLIVSGATIFNNAAQGGEVGGLTIQSNTPILENSVIAGSTGADCSTVATFLRNETNLIQDGSCSGGSNGLIGDPRLGPLSNAYGATPVHPVLTGSPLVDAGDDGACVSTGESDQTGMPRSIDGNADGVVACDIGSVEFTDIYPPILTFVMNEQDPRGTTPYTLSLEWRDEDGRLDLATIGTGDIVASGPNGFTAEFTVLSIDPGNNGSTASVTYGLSPPGGEWGPEDEGIYAFDVVENEVFDLSVTGPNAAEAQSLGTTVISFGDAPVVQDATFQITNAARIGDFVGQVVAQDPNGPLPETGAYAIIAGNGAGAFQIDDEGVITVRDHFELDRDYALTIEVTDTDGLTGEGIIDVLVDQADLLFRADFEAPDLP